MGVVNMKDCARMTFAERAKMIDDFYKGNKKFRGLDFCFPNCNGYYIFDKDVVVCDSKCPHYCKAKEE